MMRDEIVENDMKNGIDVGTWMLQEIGLTFFKEETKDDVTIFMD